MIIQFDASEYTLLNSEEDLFAQYPKRRENMNEYRPQPWLGPDKYPCLFRQEAIINNPWGADHAVLSYIYDFTEIYAIDPDYPDEREHPDFE